MGISYIVFIYIVYTDVGYFLSVFNKLIKSLESIQILSASNLKV